MVACNDWMVEVIDVRPLSAAWSVLTPFVIWSRRSDNWSPRALSDAAVKKLVGLSRAELTFFPVASRFCVVACRAEVFCRAIRFWRTAAESVTEEIMICTFLVAITRRLWGSTAHQSHASA